MHQREGRASDWESGLKAERVRRHSKETFHAGPPGSLCPGRRVQWLPRPTAVPGRLVHWCGTTIGTSLCFCLQSNPAIKRGTKSPLITPCHKVICPGAKLRRTAWCCGLGRGWGQKKGGLTPCKVNRLATESPFVSCPVRPRKNQGTSASELKGESLGCA